MSSIEGEDSLELLRYWLETNLYSSSWDRLQLNLLDANCRSLESHIKLGPEQAAYSWRSGLFIIVADWFMAAAHKICCFSSAHHYPWYLAREDPYYCLGWKNFDCWCRHLRPKYSNLNLRGFCYYLASDQSCTYLTLSLRVYSDSSLTNHDWEVKWSFPGDW